MSIQLFPMPLLSLCMVPFSQYPKPFIIVIIDAFLSFKTPLLTHHQVFWFYFQNLSWIWLFFFLPFSLPQLIQVIKINFLNEWNSFVKVFHSSYFILYKEVNVNFLTCISDYVSYLTPSNKCLIHLEWNQNPLPWPKTIRDLTPDTL